MNKQIYISIHCIYISAPRFVATINCNNSNQLFRLMESFFLLNLMKMDNFRDM